ncbi:MAG: hypothetical protein A2Y17_02850 [Clostridiales bacterium GWF2_38_85]|nr:MAG: hypothetical protein A2Y17_02850 [Clostridiales bacterium GWF2_38_85]
MTCFIFDGKIILITLWYSKFILGVTWTLDFFLHSFAFFVCVEGTGKSRIQKLVIHYRFVGYIEIPESAFTSNYKADIRQGVAVEYT